MIKKLIPYLSIIVFFSCAVPQDIIKITPHEANTDWLWGKQVVTKELKGLTVAIKYDRTDKRYLVFDVEILNNSDSKITISPTDFSIKPVVDSGLYHYATRAVDPETLLLSLDKKISRNKAAQTNAEFTSLIVNTTALTADVAMSMSKKDTPEQNAARKETREDLRQTTESNIDRRYHEGNQLQRERAFYATELLRKTTLYKGESIRGYLYFPKNKTLNLFNIILNTAPGQLFFKFKQELIPAYNTYTDESNNWYP